MVLLAIRSGAGETTFQYLQLADLIDVELLPAVRWAARALATYLEAEQPLDAAPDPVVVGLDDSGSPALVSKLDSALLADRADKLVVHYFTSRVRSRIQVRALLDGPVASDGGEKSRTILDEVRI